MLPIRQTQQAAERPRPSQTPRGPRNRALGIGIAPPVRMDTDSFARFMARPSANPEVNRLWSTCRNAMSEEALQAAARADALIVPPNSATSTAELWQMCIYAGLFGALCASSTVTWGAVLFLALQLTTATFATALVGLAAIGVAGGAAFLINRVTERDLARAT